MAGFVSVLTSMMWSVCFFSQLDFLAPLGVPHSSTDPALLPLSTEIWEQGKWEHMKDPTEIHWLDIKRRGQKESSGYCPISGVSRGWAEFMSPFPHCWVSALPQPSDFWSERFKKRHQNIKVIWEEDGEPCYLRVLLSLLSKERFFQFLCYLREIILGSYSLACVQLENRLSFNMKYAIQIQNSSFEIKSIYLIFTALGEE